MIVEGNDGDRDPITLWYTIFDVGRLRAEVSFLSVNTDADCTKAIAETSREASAHKAWSVRPPKVCNDYAEIQQNVIGEG